MYVVGQKRKKIATRTAGDRTPVQATPLAAEIPPCHQPIRLAWSPPAPFMYGICQHGGARRGGGERRGPSPRRLRPLRSMLPVMRRDAPVGSGAFHLRATAL